MPVSDSRTLVSAWSRELGRVTFGFPAGSGREARRRRALASPMALFEGRSEAKPGSDILPLRDFSPTPGSPALAAPDIARTMLCSFLAEVLDRLLQRTAPDAHLSDYLFASAAALSALPRGAASANFHIVFLYGLARMAGIAPDLSGYVPGAVFDMRDGVFRRSAPLHSDYLDADASSFLTVLARVNFNNMHRLHLSRAERRDILSAMLDYYSIHLGNLGNLRTLGVLHELE